MSDLEFTGAVELAKLVRDKQLSPVELAEHFLARIEKLDPELNSFVTVDAEGALQAAKAAEARLGEDDAPVFNGVPIGIKDLTPTAGLRTTFSCKHFADHVPDQDAAVVKRIRDAGFVILGKTNTPEFGTIPFTISELNGICRNPWDTTRTPGGSSGGAGAAVAAGLIPIAQGSDGGGSIRIPSSACGLFGIKPSRGRVSHAPHKGQVWEGCSMDGPIARSVADAAALLDVMSGYEVGDPYWLPDPQRPFLDEAKTEPGRLRIALTLEPPNAVPVDEEVQGVVRETASLLEELGHDVEEISPGWALDEMTDAFIKIVQTNPAYYGNPPADSLDPVNRALQESAAMISSLQYVQVVIDLQAAVRKIMAGWVDYDVVLCPTLAMLPPTIEWVQEETDPWMLLIRAGMFLPFCPPANVSGVPAASLPLGQSKSGLPIGVQLIGQPADEVTLIRLAAQLENARPWADRHPPLS